MFSWIISWFSSKKDPLDYYNPEERKIYSYFDGEKVIQADPMELYIKLMDIGPELGVNIKVAHSPSKDAKTARKRVDEQIRSVFGVKPFSEKGLTIVETESLLEHFMSYTYEIKKNSPPLPTIPNTTEVSDSTSKEESATESISPFGSVESEFKSNVPPMFPRG